MTIYNYLIEKNYIQKNSAFAEFLIQDVLVNIDEKLLTESDLKTIQYVTLELIINISKHINKALNTQEFEDCLPALQIVIIASR